MAKYVPLRVARERIGLSNNTLRKYADQGKIDVIKNEAGQRLFDVDGYIGKMAGTTVVCYARVSSQHQKDDLIRQRHYLSELFPEAEIITDVGSGLNFKRKGLKAILERVMSGDKLKVVVAHKDRLARFGFELIKYLVEFNGGEIVVLNGDDHSPEEELVKDILAILTVFGARVNGLRRYGKKIKEDSSLSDKGTIEDS